MCVRSVGCTREFWRRTDRNRSKDLADGADMQQPLAVPARVDDHDPHCPAKGRDEGV